VNPLESIYKTVADLFEDSGYLSGLLNKGNIRRYDRTPAEIDAYNSGDTPHLELLPVVGTDNNYRVTTDDVNFDFSIQLIASTDNTAFGLNQFAMLNFHWKILQTLVAAGTTLGNPYIIEYQQTAWEPIRPEDRLDDASDAGWQSQSTLTFIVRVPTTEVRSM